ncbi:MAG: PH domain-containing protein [Patescibacteria group bacterium]
MLHLNHLPGADLHEASAIVYRRHPITLVPFFFLASFVFFLPAGAYLTFSRLMPNVITVPEYFAIFIMSASLFFLFGLLFLFQYFLDYWCDVFIVTDKRILDIEQKGLFSRTVSELRLYRTQDVTTEVKGIMHSIFDYGDVFIQTAGEKQRFVFEDVPHPTQIAKLILELSEKNRAEQLELAVEDFGLPDADDVHAKKEAMAKRIEP